MRRNGIRTTLLVTVGTVGVMLTLVAASVPLYRLFCRVTGVGGTTQTALVAPGARVGQSVVVRFDASVAPDLPWRFKPSQARMTVTLGEQTLAFYTVTNFSPFPVTGTATFNVTPDKVGQFFNKIECFCFTQQTLQPGQTAELPVSFFVDPGLQDDPLTNEVGTITLSYTFFRQGSS